MSTDGEEQLSRPEGQQQGEGVVHQAARTNSSTSKNVVPKTAKLLVQGVSRRARWNVGSR